MALRVKDDIVQLETVIGTNSTQTVADGTVAIPGSMLPANRIVKVTAVPNIKEHWAEEDRVNLDGTITVNIIYAGEDDTGKTYYGSIQIPDAIPFSRVVDVPGATPNMLSQCEAAVLDLQSAVRSDGRTVDLDIVLELTAAAVSTQEIAVVTDASAEAAARLKVAKDVLHIEDVIGRGTAKAQIRELIPIPGGSGSDLRLLEISGRFRPVENRVEIDRAVIVGTMSYKAIFAGFSVDTGEEQIIVHRWDEVSGLELSVEIYGSHPGMMAYPRIAAPMVSGQLVNDGQSLAVEGELTADVKVVQPLNVSVVTDLTSESDVEIRVRQETIQVQQVGDTAFKDIYVDGTVQLTSSHPPLERLLDVEARAAVTGASVVGGRVVVSGYVDLTALYVARTDDFSQPVYHAAWSNVATFETSISVPALAAMPEGETEASVDIHDVRAEPISRDTISFHVMGSVSCRLKETMSKEVVAEVVELRQFKGRPPTYTCVTVQPDDTLWKLATKYRTTVENLLEANPNLAEAAMTTGGGLPVGSKVLITLSVSSELE
ncbi:MAG: DUF3794 domain-containing protein [Firmicutes bacterium]|nr:DUF3794 domain-containing protein [Bacillota bacterium]